MPEPEITTVSAEEITSRLVAGDILLTRFPSGGLLAEAIEVGQSLADGHTAIWGHAMRYVGEGRVISQEWRVRLKPLAAWAGSYLCRLHNPSYSPEQRRTLVFLALRAEGRLYDVLGLLGQALRGLPLVGSLASRVVQVPWLTYCSEMVAEHERRVDPGFMAGTPKPAPDEMPPWARAHGWLVETYRLVAGA